MGWQLNDLGIYGALMEQIKEVKKDIEYYNRKTTFYANEEEVDECNMKIEYLKGKLEGLKIASAIINC